MIGKIGVLVAALAAMYLVSRLISGQGRRVEKTLSKSARKGEEAPPKTLERDPETGKYRARDDRRTEG